MMSVPDIVNIIIILLKMPQHSVRCCFRICSLATCTAQQLSHSLVSLLDTLLSNQTVVVLNTLTHSRTTRWWTKALWSIQACCLVIGNEPNPLCESTRNWCQSCCYQSSECECVWVCVVCVRAYFSHPPTFSRNGGPHNNLWGHGPHK